MKKPVIILLHTGYWVMYLLLLTLFFGMFVAEIKHDSATIELGSAFFVWARLMLAIAIVPGLIGFYGFYNFLFNKFLKRKRIGAFFLGTLGIGIFGSLCGMFVFTAQQYASADFWSEPMAIVSIVVLLSFVTIVNGVLGLVMKGFISWYGDIRVKEELTNKNNAIELSLIKAQLNPHFLFNTINNIDVLILKDPTQASVYLNKLSELLRYMLYETKTEEVRLEQELQYIEDYLSLQRIRTNNPTFIVYNKKGSSGNWSIAPMLFIPFLENAFKYSENKKIDRAIEITITISESNIVFRCVNQFAPKEQIVPSSGGLGHSLIRRRLDLLYEGKYKLEIDMNSHVYIVNLELSR